MSGLPPGHGDDDGPSQLDVLSARILGVANVVSFLLACEARRRPDRTAMFRELSSAATTRLELSIAPESTDPAEITFQAMVQAEVDRLIGDARHMLGEGKGEAPGSEPPDSAQ